MSDSKSKHESDDLNLEDEHKRVSQNTDGGRCLVPYRSYSQQSCSYRWQAYKQALHERELYNGDRYKELLRNNARQKIKMLRQRRAKKGERRWEEMEVDAPQKGEWDVSEQSANFQGKCNAPYWFEAHHIIPHSQLKGAISRVGEGKPDANELQLMVRRGLMKEEYNLNHKLNMLILPMDGGIAKALRLPKHLAMPSHWDHPRYSKYVELKIKEFFNPVMETISEHQIKIEYQPVKSKLENLSTTLRDDIKKAGEMWGTKDDVSVDDVSGDVDSSQLNLS